MPTRQDVEAVVAPPKKEAKLFLTESVIRKKNVDTGCNTLIDLNVMNMLE